MGGRNTEEPSPPRFCRYFSLVICVSDNNDLRLTGTTTYHVGLSSIAMIIRILKYMKTGYS
jgi:hypothetical protein